MSFIKDLLKWGGVRAVTNPLTGGIALVGGDSANLLAAVGGAVANRIGYKPVGITVNHNSPTGRTWCFKCAVPVGDFYAAQLVIYHGDTTASTNVTYAAILAATETADQSDQATTGLKTYCPTVGGTQYKGVGNTSGGYGWRAVTWSGASTQAASAASSNNNPNIYVSDVIPVMSVARSDSDQTLPLIMGRINTQGATGTTDYTAPSNTTVTGCAGGSGAYTLTCTPGAGGSFLQAKVGDYVSGTNVGASAVVQSVDSASQITVTVANSGVVSAATLTFTATEANAAGGNKLNASVATSDNGGLLLQGYFLNDAGGTYVSAPSTNNPSSTLNGTVPAFGLILYSSSVGPTFMMFGDSTVQNNAISRDGISSWGLKAAAALAAQGVPCGWINQGASSQTTASYSLNADSALSAWKPTLAGFQVWSHNNNSVTAFSSTGAVQYWRALLGGYVGSFVATCKKYGVSPMVTTGIPELAISTGAIDAIRTGWLSYIKAAVDNFLVFDTNAAVTDGASPERISAANDYGDGIHINCTTGIPAMSAALLLKIKAAIGVL